MHPEGSTLNIIYVYNIHSTTLLISCVLQLTLLSSLVYFIFRTQGKYESTLSFLPEYKNPCWKEPLPDGNPYHNNSYRTYIQMRIRFDLMAKKWYALRNERNATLKWRLRCLPFFYIAGPAKTATTDIFLTMGNHPEVVLPRVKEPHWWTMGRIGQDS